MASYSFRCKNCGDFTEDHHSIKEEKTFSFCPRCERRSERLYLAPYTLTMKKTLKNKLDRGPEPKKMRKEEITGSKFKSKKNQSSRPWQLG